MKKVTLFSLGLLLSVLQAFAGGRTKPASARLYEEAVAAAQKGDFALAESKAKQLIKKDPKNTEARNLLEAVTIEDSFPKSPFQILYREAFDAVLKNDLCAAEKKVRAALAIDPESPEARRLLEGIQNKLKPAQPGGPAEPTAGENSPLPPR